MDNQTNRRDFLLTGALTTGALAGQGAAARGGQPQPNPRPETAPAKQGASGDYPRYHAGAGGPVGSATDRGKLVPGLRDPFAPPVPIETPDLTKLSFKMVDGAKEFHLYCQPVKRELLPNVVINHWGFNGGMPGPTIEVVEGDRVRIVVHNELPEPTSLHLHGLELAIAQDGVPWVVQDPIPPGETHTYEYHLHQTGTYFYHAHFPMQEAIGMVGFFIIHPRTNYTPAVDQDFGLIMQEFAIDGTSDTPDTTSMDFNFLTFNGRCGPFATPMVVRLGNRVRIRIVNFSTADHHPIHIHGHTFWVTGTEGGRIPDTAWIPGNNVLVGVAQAREFEFVANNPGDWIMHCHMFHHMMNHMISGVGPGSRGMAKGGQEDPRYRVPAYPQGTGMMAMMNAEEIKKVNNKKETRGMRPQWYRGVDGLFTVVRVLPSDLYDKVMSGEGEVMPGASVPGAKPSSMGNMKMKG